MLPGLNKKTKIWMFLFFGTLVAAGSLYLFSGRGTLFKGELTGAGSCNNATKITTYVNDGKNNAEQNLEKKCLDSGGRLCDASAQQVSVRKCGCPAGIAWREASGCATTTAEWRGFPSGGVHITAPNENGVKIGTLHFDDYDYFESPRRRVKLLAFQIQDITTRSYASKLSIQLRNVNGSSPSAWVPFGQREAAVINVDIGVGSWAERDIYLKVSELPGREQTIRIALVKDVVDDGRDSRDGIKMEDGSMNTANFPLQSGTITIKNKPIEALRQVKVEASLKNPFPEFGPGREGVIGQFNFSGNTSNNPITITSARFRITDSSLSSSQKTKLSIRFADKTVPFTEDGIADVTGFSVSVAPNRTVEKEISLIVGNDFPTTASGFKIQILAGGSVEANNGVVIGPEFFIKTPLIQVSSGATAGTVALSSTSGSGSGVTNEAVFGWAWPAGSAANGIQIPETVDSTVNLGTFGFLSTLGASTLTSITFTLEGLTSTNPTAFALKFGTLTRSFDQNGKVTFSGLHTSIPSVLEEGGSEKIRIELNQLPVQEEPSFKVKIARAADVIVAGATVKNEGFPFTSPTLKFSPALPKLNFSLVPGSGVAGRPNYVASTKTVKLSPDITEREAAQLTLRADKDYWLSDPLTFTVASDDPEIKKRVALRVHSDQPSVNLPINIEFVAPANIVSPMQTGPADAERKTYVEVPKNEDDAANSANKDKGYINIPFEVQTAGEYIVWALVNAPDSNSNEFYAFFDETPANIQQKIAATNPNGARQIWWIKPENKWKWVPIVLESDDPAKSAGHLKKQLSAETHNLILWNREPGTKIDQIVITTEKTHFPLPVFANSNGKISVPMDFFFPANQDKILKFDVRTHQLSPYNKDFKIEIQKADLPTSFTTEGFGTASNLPLDLNFKNEVPNLNFAYAQAADLTVRQPLTGDRIRLTPETALENIGQFTLTPNNSSTTVSGKNFENGFLSFQITEPDDLNSLIGLRIRKNTNNPTPIVREAEQADTFVAPMVSAIDSKASNGSYAWTPEGAGNRGRAIYKIQIPEGMGGKYAVWGRVNGLPASSSFHVFVNKTESEINTQLAAPAIYDEDNFRNLTSYNTWLIPTDGLWRWIPLVNWLKKENIVSANYLYETPRYIDLHSGENTITVISRQDGTKLDKLFITKKLEFVPSDENTGSSPGDGFFYADEAGKIKIPLLYRFTDNQPLALTLDIKVRNGTPSDEPFSVELLNNFAEPYTAVQQGNTDDTILEWAVPAGFTGATKSIAIRPFFIAGESVAAASAGSTSPTLTASLESPAISAGYIAAGASANILKFRLTPSVGNIYLSGINIRKLSASTLASDKVEFVELFEGNSNTGTKIGGPSPLTTNGNVTFNLSNYRFTTTAAKTYTVKVKIKNNAEDGKTLKLGFTASSDLDTDATASGDTIESNVFTIGTEPSLSGTPANSGTSTTTGAQTTTTSAPPPGPSAELLTLQDRIAALREQVEGAEQAGSTDSGTQTRGRASAPEQPPQEPSREISAEVLPTRTSPPSQPPQTNYRPAVATLQSTARLRSAPEASGTGPEILIYLLAPLGAYLAHLAKKRKRL